MKVPYHFGRRPPESSIWHRGPLTINEARREAFWQGCRLGLTPTEFATLCYLAYRAGQVVSYSELLQAVWNTSLEQGGSLDQVRSTIKRLRQKLGETPEHPRYLANVRGIGYRLDLPSEARKASPSHLPLPSKPAFIVKLLAVVVGLTLAIAWLLWRQFPWGDPFTPAWYQGHRVPIGLLHLLDRGPFCVASPPEIYCFDQEEEVAAATGKILPDTDPEIVDDLRRTGTVPILRAEWGNPTQRVWFGQQTLPFGVMWYQTKGQAFCHDRQGPGILTCFATAEELAAATGLPLPGTKAEIVQPSQNVAGPAGCAVYVVLYEHSNYQGRALALCHDVPDLSDVLFDGLASSLWIPSGKAAVGFEATIFRGSAHLFPQSLPSLAPLGIDKALRSIRQAPPP
jgi:DNA-binding winged helix-turn-helix (wHTH) protein